MKCTHDDQNMTFENFVFLKHILGDYSEKSMGIECLRPLEAMAMIIQQRASSLSPWSGREEKRTTTKDAK